MGKIRIGIVGYGNIGRGVEQSIKRNDDMELKAVFTRRDPASVKIQTEGAEVKHFDDMEAMKDDIDVMILCGGSATDLPVIGPKVAASFNTIDSFDTHAKIPEYFANVDKAAKEGKNVSIISVGWDPGMFSLNRLYAESILVQGSTYTFWGKGVSQGHSDAIRRVEGVKDGKQYTIPVEASLEAAVVSVDVSVVACAVSGFVLNLASATPDASLISDIQSVTLTGLPVCTTIESFAVASGATVSFIFTVTLYSFLS